MPRPDSGTDVYVYNLLDSIVPSFCKMHIHPNIVTILSILSKPLLYKVLKSKQINGNLLLTLMLFHGILDCLDGEVARGCYKYSVLGSRLDFLNDQTFLGILLCVLLAIFSSIKFSKQNVIYAIITVCLFNLVINKLDIDDHSMKKGTISEKIHDNSILCILIMFCVINFLK